MFNGILVKVDRCSVLKQYSVGLAYGMDWSTGLSKVYEDRRVCPDIYRWVSVRISK